MSKVVAKDLGHVEIAKLKQYAATNQNTIDTAVQSTYKMPLFAYGPKGTGEYVSIGPKDSIAAVCIGLNIQKTKKQRLWLF